MNEQACVASPFNEAEQRLFAELNRRGVRFLLVGLSAAVLQGADVVTQDLDLWFGGLLTGPRTAPFASNFARRLLRRTPRFHDRGARSQEMVEAPGVEPGSECVPR